jgi:hypothetical protein
LQLNMCQELQIFVFVYISWYSFLKGWVDPGHMYLSDASEKIPSDTTGDRSGDLLTSSAVP